MQHTSAVQWQAGYEQFHTSGRTGKKLLHVEKSTFDNIIGRDIGHCGESSNKDRFNGLAGKPSQPKLDAPSKKTCAPTTSSTVASPLWGQGFDQSGVTPRSGRRGNYSMKSTMDETLFGRDLDYSGSDPHAHFEKTYTGHAGVRSAHAADRPFRKPTCAMQASADEVIFGLDTDRSGPNPQKEHMRKNYGTHAGLKTDDRIERPYRKKGISMQATVDDVVFHHDVDFSGEAPQTERFGRLYHDHAGRMSGGGVRTATKQVDPRDPSFGKAKKGAGATGATLASTNQPMSECEVPASDAGSMAGSSLAEGLQMSGAGGSNAGKNMTSEAGTSDYGVSLATRSSTSWAGYPVERPRSSCASSSAAGVSMPRSSCASSSAAGGDRPRWR